ncbi:hypothetical protein NDU88_007023 [Pleurodeles waltl]|uniref:Uncharacterized protein n=1 Tax=Pleurodeles waltl TaxID=8319 RepID=A0AAV7U138_PLEWA|nr:hypothetical protein NDU88_007023 [Pleurodeles waltl]
MQSDRGKRRSGASSRCSSRSHAGTAGGRQWRGSLGRRPGPVVPTGRASEPATALYVDQWSTICRSSDCTRGCTWLVRPWRWDLEAWSRCWGLTAGDLAQRPGMSGWTCVKAGEMWQQSNGMSLKTMVRRAEMR